jgi:hypothetical protein
MLNLLLSVGWTMVFACRAATWHTYTINERVQECKSQEVPDAKQSREPDDIESGFVEAQT